jgi:hypothetical protein
VPFQIRRNGQRLAPHRSLDLGPVLDKATEKS